MRIIYLGSIFCTVYSKIIEISATGTSNFLHLHFDFPFACRDSVTSFIFLFQPQTLLASFYLDRQ